MNNKYEKQSDLKLIPIYEDYIEYMINLLKKIPKSEKFSLGSEFKLSMYETYRNIMYVNKIEEKNKMYYLNKIDAELNLQRILLRIMKNNNWIPYEKFDIVMKQKIAECGKIVGGLLKYYAKNSKKCV